jgi:hypothetical protein
MKLPVLVPNIQHSNVEPDLRRQLENSTKTTTYRRHQVIAVNGSLYCRRLLEDKQPSRCEARRAPASTDSNLRKEFCRKHWHVWPSSVGRQATITRSQLELPHNHYNQKSNTVAGITYPQTRPRPTNVTHVRSISFLLAHAHANSYTIRLGVQLVFQQILPNRNWSAGN